jgi:hypothetical protein
MNKKLVIYLVVIVIIGLLANFFFDDPIFRKVNPNGPKENCAGQDEDFDPTDDLNPNECCQGVLPISNTDDQISVADECYSNGIVYFKASSQICSNCGNKVCSHSEDPCNCPEDCRGQLRSDFLTVEDFCNEGYDQYCDKYSFTELCRLCN